MGFYKFKILMARVVQKTNMLQVHGAKFRNMAIGQSRDLRIYPFEMAAAPAIFDFQKFTNLTVGGFQRVHVVIS